MQSNEILEKLVGQLLESFDIPDDEKFREQSQKTDRELLTNRITPHLKQWYLDTKPFVIGNTFVAIRSWQENLIKENPKFEGRKPIKIDPGISFGWDHQTTLLVVDILETHWKGERLLDVGTGTGIAAIAAALMMPDSFVDAFDISQDVVENAEQNIEINDLSNKINLKETYITEYPSDYYDVIVANLLPATFKIVKHDLIRCLKPGGKLIISGFSDQINKNITATFDWLDTSSVVTDIKDNDVINVFQELGLTLVEKRQLKEWVGAVMQKESN